MRIPCGLILLSLTVVFPLTSSLLLFGRELLHLSLRRRIRPTTYDFDLAIIGAGASGGFALSAASLFGKRVCLIEKNNFAGGDCTNAACVPSKALRSFAALSRRGPPGSNLMAAQQYVYDTVRTVRARENPAGMEQRNPTVVYRQVKDCYFVDPYTMNITESDQDSNSTACCLTSNTLTARNFLLTTGAAPVMPEKLRQSATAAKLHVSTYQSLLRPETGDKLWHLIDDVIVSRRPFRLLVIGGGATACELAQSLGRLTFGFEWIQIILVAPGLLTGEDVKLQEAAGQILRHAGVEWISGRVVDFSPDKSVRIVEAFGNESRMLAPIGAALFCMGRSPVSSLESLKLEDAQIKWSDKGVHVHPNTLQSVSAPHVFAAGDCCDAVPSRLRTASQAAWTGFHAVRNLCLPSVLLVSDKSSVQRNIPRVIYTE